MPETQIITVTASAGDYPVEIGIRLLPTLAERLHTLLPATSAPSLVVLTSPEIWRLHGASLATGFPQQLKVLEIPAGEQHKRLSTVERLLEELAQHGADRDTVLLAFGGGVIGDITGFVAATYMRGIRYIGVPTTLLAQVDSSVGGKTGVNLAAGKNLAGAFHPPIAVFADVNTLSTLPPRELRAGLQESIKAGIIRDPALFHFLETEHEAVLSGDPAALIRVVADSVRMKAKVVAADERESGERMLLNLGHTLGHAIEAATGFGELLHGEAIAWGMLAALELAALRKLVTADDAARIHALIRLYGPLKTFSADAEHLVALTAGDKKNRSGTRSFVLPVGIGDATVVRDLSEADLLAVATRLVAEASEKPAL